MSSTNSDPHDLQRQLRHMLYGYTTTQLLYVAAKTGLADHLSEGPQGLESLAAAMAVEAAVLPRLLRALVALGLIREESAAHYALTPLGALLKSDGPGALRDQAIMTGEVLFPAWGGLLQTLQSGDTAFELIFDQTFFDFLQASPEIKAHFFKFLAAGARSATTELLTAYDFNTARKIVDVGGGNGALLAAILTQYPQPEGVLFDMETVTPAAEQTLERQGLLARCQVISGDFFQSMPGGGDLYLLSQILHDWDDAHCLTILRNCREAMQPGDKLLIIEQLMPDELSAAGPAIQQDLFMLVLTGGQKRTADAYRALLEATGFELAQVIHTQADRSLIEAVAIDQPK